MDAASLLLRGGQGSVCLAGPCQFISDRTAHFLLDVILENLFLERHIQLFPPTA
jgi:hypothetical protein